VTGAVVLVEGVSDQQALETLAARRERDLVAEGVTVLPIGGAGNIGHVLARLEPHQPDLRLAGMCDAREERAFHRALSRAGLLREPGRAAMERRGFFVCEMDLEDELIRALGVAAVEEIIAAEGELASLRTFRKQPAQRGRASDAQLRRFLGTRQGRKIRYASLLVAALDLAAVPRPLDGVLAAV
jgi:hypothetical protein